MVVNTKLKWNFNIRQQKLFLKTLKYWVGIQWDQSITSWGESASLVLVGHPSSDGVTIEIPYGVDVLLSTSLAPHLFLLGWLKLNPREMNAGGNCGWCWCLMFFGFLRTDLSPWGYGNKCFLVALCHLMVRRLNFEVPPRDFSISR